MDKIASDATSIVPKIFSPLESILASIGLNTPVYRFLFTLLSGLAAELYIKPSYAFNGSIPKTPIYLENKPGNTYTPLGFFPALAGIIMFLFV